MYIWACEEQIVEVMKQTLLKALGCAGLFFLFSCKPALWQQGAQPTLSLPEGSTYYKEDMEHLPLAAITSLPLSDAWLIIKLPSGQHFGLPWQEARPQADKKSVSLSTVLSDTLRWVSFGGGTLRHRPVNPELRKRRTIKWKGISYVDIALHPTVAKKWEQVKPIRFWIGASKWKTRSIKAKVDLRLAVVDQDSQRVVRCQARNTSGQAWTLFQPNGAIRFHFYARGWGKPGNHTLHFLPEFQKSMQSLALLPGQWVTVFNFPVTGFTQQPTHMEWRYGKKISLPGLVPPPGNVPSVEIWFSVVQEGKPYVSDPIVLSL